MRLGRNAALGWTNILVLRDWLRHWLLFFHKTDGYHGDRLPQFIATLWSILLLRNEQVFRQVRPTTDSILRSLQKSDEQHATFTDERTQPIPRMREPITPPGFYQVQLGHHTSEDWPLKIQIHAVWDKLNLSTGIGWVVSSSLGQQSKEYGCFSYTSFAIAATATACLKAVTWAKTAGHLNIILMTSSTHLLQILRSSDYQDITIKWTIEPLRTTGHSLISCQVLRVCSTQITEAQ